MSRTAAPGAGRAPGSRRLSPRERAGDSCAHRGLTHELPQNRLAQTGQPACQRHRLALQLACQSRGDLVHREPLPGCADDHRLGGDIGERCGREMIGLDGDHRDPRPGGGAHRALVLLCRRPCDDHHDRRGVRRIAAHADDILSAASPRSERASSAARTPVTARRGGASAARRASRTMPSASRGAIPASCISDAAATGRARGSTAARRAPSGWR